MFLFTLISVGAAAALFFVVFLPRSSDANRRHFPADLRCRLATRPPKLAVSQARLYRYGIEEALAACSVGFLCAGMQVAFFSGSPYSPNPDAVQFLVPAAGAVFSLWIWRRFGLWYAFLAAMIFAVFLPGYWTSSHVGAACDRRRCSMQSG